MAGLGSQRSTSECKPLLTNSRERNLKLFRNICKWTSIFVSTCFGLILISISSVYFYFSPTIIWFEKCPANPNTFASPNLTMNNYDQFLGRWYDMAHTKNPFQNGLCPTDTYLESKHGPRVFLVDYEETDVKTKERKNLNPQSLTFVKNGVLHANFSYDPKDEINPDSLTDGNYKVFYLTKEEDGEGNDKIGNIVTVYSCLDLPVIGSAPMFWVMSREVNQLPIDQLHFFKDMIVGQYQTLGASEKAVKKMRDTFEDNIMENCPQD